MFWFMPNLGQKWHHELITRYAPDMAKDKVMMFLHKMFLPSHFALGGVLFAMGYFGTALGMGTTGRWLVDGDVGPLRANGVCAPRHLVGELRHAPVGLPQRTKRATTAATYGGWASWRSAKVGTTTTTPTSASPPKATNGGSSTSPTGSSWLLEKVGLAWNVIRVSDIPKGAKPA